MEIALQPSRVETASSDEEGLLVFANGKLTGVLVKLGEDHGDELHGRWFLEAGFGRLAATAAQTFTCPDEATRWIVQRLAA